LKWGSRDTGDTPKTKWGGSRHPVCFWMIQKISSGPS
jgi:hypothetical protein